MIKKIGVIFVACMLLAGGLLAKTYEIPDDLKIDVATYKEAFEKNPTNNTRFDLAMSYAYTGQIIKGWSTLKELSPEYAAVVIKNESEVIKKEPKNWKAHFKLAFGEYFKGDKDKAQQSFLKVIEIDPKNVWAMGYYALIEGEKGNNDSALEWCQKALDIEPNATGIHFLKAEGHRRKGEIFKALGHMMIVGRLTTEENIELPDAL